MKKLILYMGLIGVIFFGVFSGSSPGEAFAEEALVLDKVEVNGFFEEIMVNPYTKEVYAECHLENLEAVCDYKPPYEDAQGELNVDNWNFSMTWTPPPDLITPNKTYEIKTSGEATKTKEGKNEGTAGIRMHPYISGGDMTANGDKCDAYNMYGCDAYIRSNSDGSTDKADKTYEIKADGFAFKNGLEIRFSFNDSSPCNGGSVTYKYVPKIESCPESAKVELIGLEVIQSIQDWKNSVTLIEGKETWVRAHLQPKDNKGDPVPVNARLRAFRGGVELPQSPLAPTPNGIFAAQPDAVRNRHLFDRSLNFKLPPEWLNGTVKVRLEKEEVDGTEICCKEVAGTPNDCSVQVTFLLTAVPEVKFYWMEWTREGELVSPTFMDIDDLAQRLTAIYPIKKLNWTVGSPSIWNIDNSLPPLGIALVDLVVSRTADRCFDTLGCKTIYFYVIKADVPGVQGKASDLGPYASTYMSTLLSSKNTFGIGRHVHSHEIAHLHGLDHAVHSDLGFKEWDVPGLGGIRRQKKGWCNEEASLSEPDFPYDKNYPKPYLGPMHKGENEKIFGLDTDSLGTTEDPVMAPFSRRYDLMSYCKEWNYRWISKFNYERLRLKINSRFGQAGTAQMQFKKALEAPQDYLLVRGTIDFSDDSVMLMPFTTISSQETPPGQPTGGYLLQLLDANDALLQEVSFQPTDDISEGLLTGSFILPVLADPAIKGAVVLRNGNTLASQSASANSPTVQVLFPNGGENLSDNPVILNWTGSDLDGDTLTYLVQYSHDGGITWNTLAIDWPEGSYKVDRNFLRGSSNGLIRVTASDGFNTSIDESDGPFSVPNNAPLVSIIKPTTDERFIGDQLLFFKATALDMEDQTISDSNLQWSSSVDGSLGTGNNFSKRASNLSEGDHEITLTAVDSESNSKSASVNINVLRTIDADEDGLPDDWEQQVIDASPDDAITTLNDVKPDSDFDEDGESNWIEYANDTDPTDPMSARRGDTNDDKYIDLADAITSLKVVSGIDISSGNLTVAGGVDEDQRIGLEEAIYIMQKLSDLSESSK